MTYFAMERDDVREITDAELVGQLFESNTPSVTVQKLVTAMNVLCGDRNE